MKNKMKNKKGFTLMEMLIVVAIMVVLVAVAVPTFSTQLNNAKDAADAANERAAKAVAATMYLSEDIETNQVYHFHADTGKLVKGGVPTNTYGKTRGSYVSVKVDDAGNIKIGWDGNVS